MPTPAPLPAVRIDLSNLGKLTFCPTILPVPCGTYVIQRVGKGFGNVPYMPNKDLQLRRHVPTNWSKTVPQTIRRQLFASAVHSWQMLGPTERLQWSTFGKRHALPGYNEYISAFMRGGLGT